MAITKIQKRNGEIADFQLTKIKDAIFAAVKSVGGNDEMKAGMLAKKQRTFSMKPTVPVFLPWRTYRTSWRKC